MKQRNDNFQKVVNNLLSCYVENEYVETDKDIVEKELNQLINDEISIKEKIVHKKMYLAIIEEKESKIVAMRQRDRHNKNEEKIQQIEPRTDGCSNTLTSVQKDNLVYDRKGFDSRTKGFRESELSPTLSTKMGTGGNNVPMICPTLTQELAHTTGKHFNAETFFKLTGQLRRLTPKECFRLMGFTDNEINLEGLSDMQKYKLAGNGQDVNMVSLIFQQMFKDSLKEQINKLEKNKNV
jgi:site-specific DNA-cytosine methylase